MATLNAGRHEVTVVGAEAVSSSKKGTPGILFTFEDGLGSRFSGELWLAESRKLANGKTLTMLGFDPFKDESWSEGYGLMRGSRCQIVIEDKTWDNGTVHPQLKWINPPEDGGSDDGSPDAIGAARSLFQGAAKATASAPAQKPLTCAHLGSPCDYKTCKCDCEPCDAAVPF